MMGVVCFEYVEAKLQNFHLSDNLTEETRG